MFNAMFNWTGNLSKSVITNNTKDPFYTSDVPMARTLQLEGKPREAHKIEFNASAELLLGIDERNEEGDRLVDEVAFSMEGLTQELAIAGFEPSKFPENAKGFRVNKNSAQMSNKSLYIAMVNMHNTDEAEADPLSSDFYFELVEPETVNSDMNLGFVRAAEMPAEDKDTTEKIIESNNDYPESYGDSVEVSLDSQDD